MNKILLIIFLSLFFSCNNDDNDDNFEIKSRATSNNFTIQKDTIKVLAIGNSFSEDAVENHLSKLAESAGKKIVIGNLYYGGASLDFHLQSTQSDAHIYRYYKYNLKNEINIINSYNIKRALNDEKWDYVSMQQVSQNSGMYATFVTPLPLLIKYINTNTIGYDPKIILHQTWAYSPTSTHLGFANYNNNQLYMYRSIVEAYELSKKDFNIDFIVPTGTGIQNARTTSLGNDLTRDGYHLNLRVGRYIAACVWFEKLFKVNVIGNKYKPEGVSDLEIKLIQQAAHYAVLKPSKITDIK
ncbi:DUF4886 domain-containing protein [Algoriella xinjiangensis]|nr:DUF4886 domain-containing protein [Algoriella xinjiangensis]